MSASPLAERDRRWEALNAAMAAEELDALLFVGNDYRGHKGSLRYVADHAIVHRYGYAVMPRDGEPIVALPVSQSGSQRSGWVRDYRFFRHTAEGVCSLLRELPRCERVGIVGLAQVMRVEEHDYLREHLPGTTFIDASVLFERVRSRKSETELRALEESAYIADRCFDRLLEIARPGSTRRAMAAEMYRTCALLGGEDPLFLTMHPDVHDGQAFPGVTVPRDEVLHPNELFVFSFELVGPSGFWVELARMIAFAKPTEDQQRLERAVARGLEAAEVALVPGAAPADPQRQIVAAAEAEGVQPAYWSGHGIGQDVIEEPWIGLEVVQEHEDVRPSDVTLHAGMAVSLHPFVIEEQTGEIGYMADTFVIRADETRRLSEHPLTIHRPHQVAA